MEYKYYIYYPSGNETALVQGIVENDVLKNKISDAILKENPNVEQVGFIEILGEKNLIMAGNEFCANASRCAIYEYLKGKKGQIDLKVSGCNEILVGRIKGNKVYLEMPYVGKNKVEILKKGYYKVDLDGIQHLVIDIIESEKYLRQNKDIKIIGMELLQKYNITEKDANGVILMEKINGIIKINPIVAVRQTGVLLYETSCGSGSIAVGIAMEIKNNCKQEISLMQPSGKFIDVTCENINNKYNISIAGVIEKYKGLKTIIIGDEIMSKYEVKETTEVLDIPEYDIDDIANEYLE